jgi:hypothetical protein
VYADARSPLARLGLGAVYWVVQLALATGFAYLLLELLPVATPGGLVWLVGLPASFAVGRAVGSTFFAATLLALHIALGPKAPKHANEVFAAQGIIDRKNFVRLHLDRDGTMTATALGVDRACRGWTYAGTGGSGPRFRPSRDAPSPGVIDGPLRFGEPGPGG